MKTASTLLERAQRYLSFDPAGAPGARIVRLVFLGGVLFVIGWLVYFAAATAAIPYPIEYREGAAQVAVEILLRGGNPFAFEHQPLGMNNYGIAYTLAVFPFAALFGNTLLVHRAVTLVFLLLCGLLVYQAAFEKNRDRWLSLACGLLVVIPLTSRGGLGAFPSTMGVCLFLAAVLIPFRRSFDYAGLLISSVLCLIAFYTKPYFLLAFGIVSAYAFLFVSKKKGLLYALFFLLAFAFWFLLVRHVLKLYFIDILVGNLANANRSMEHMIAQGIDLLGGFYPAVSLALLMLVLAAARLNRGAAAPRLHLSAADRPLISAAPDYLLFVFGCSALAFALLLGPHVGSYLSYAYQLVTPPFLLWLFRRLGGWQSRLVLIAAPVLLFNLAALSLRLMSSDLLAQRDSPEWTRLYAYVDCSWDILNSPVIVPAVLECGRLPVDSGQTEYYYRFEPYPRMLVVGPEYRVVKRLGREYKEAITAAVGRAEFDRAILTREQWLYAFTHAELVEHYALVDTIHVSMPQTERHWSIEIWEPAEP